MIKNKSVLAIIPARGGSRGLPRKNILKLGDKPLIAWTIEAGKSSKYIDRLILSSEDTEIIDISKKWGCEVPFIRPPELAMDQTPGIDAVLHAVETIPEKYDYVVLLQPTSPLRDSIDIDDCLEFFMGKCAPACVSVVETSKSPYWMYFLDEDNKMISVIETDKAIHQRQILQKSYVLNGAIYVSKTEYLTKERSFLTGQTIAYKMSEDHSVDIDTIKDFNYAESILKNR